MGWNRPLKASFGKLLLRSRTVTLNPSAYTLRSPEKVWPLSETWGRGAYVLSCPLLTFQCITIVSLSVEVNYFSFHVEAPIMAEKLLHIMSKKKRVWTPVLTLLSLLMLTVREYEEIIVFSQAWKTLHEENCVVSLWESSL